VFLYSWYGVSVLLKANSSAQIHPDRGSGWACLTHASQTGSGVSSGERVSNAQETALGRGTTTGNGC